MSPPSSFSLLSDAAIPGLSTSHGCDRPLCGRKGNESLIKAIMSCSLASDLCHPYTGVYRGDLRLFPCFDVGLGRHLDDSHSIFVNQSAVEDGRRHKGLWQPLHCSACFSRTLALHVPVSCNIYPILAHFVAGACCGSQKPHNACSQRPNVGFVLSNKSEPRL